MDTRNHECPMSAEELTALSGAPRVEACIAATMRKHPGISDAARLRYFEAVHQELAPLARELECEGIKLREQLAEAWAEVEKWKTKAIQRGQDAMKQGLEAADLRAAIERLRPDAERLDWLANPANTVAQVLLPREVVEANVHSLRDAIDAARGKKEPT